jgi:hypothetical protein
MLTLQCDKTKPTIELRPHRVSRRQVRDGLPVVNSELSTIRGVYAGHRRTQSLAYCSRSTSVEPC